jgi:membrane associated rhomboid family serine protease
MSPSTPWVTLSLIVANLSAAYGLYLHPDWVDRWGFHAANPSLATALLSLFLHLNVLHLMGNMVFLAAVGPAVEVAAGWLRFLSVYLVGGLAGMGMHALLAGPQAREEPLIGASGAVASCIGYYSVRYSSTRVPLAPKVLTPVWLVVAVWLTLQILGAFVRIGDSGGVAFWAHLGGFGTGIVLSLWFRAPEVHRRASSWALLSDMEHRSPAARLAAAEAHLKAYPRDVEALRSMADALHSLGDAQREAETLLWLVELVGNDERPALVHRLQDLNALDRMDPISRRMLADRIARKDPEAARALLLSILARPSDDPQRPEALLSLVALENDPAAQPARKWLDELATMYPFHPATELARRRGWLA